MQFRVTRVYHDQINGRDMRWVSDTTTIHADDILAATERARRVYTQAHTITVEVYDPYNCI